MAITLGRFGNVDDLGWEPKSVADDGGSPDGIPWITYQDPVPAQYYGEDAELWPNDDELTDQDSWVQVEAQSGPVIADVITAPTQYIEDAWEWSMQDDEAAQPIVIPTGYQQADARPQAEDAWDWFWATDDDDQILSDDYAIIDVVAVSVPYYGEDAELLAQEDDDHSDQLDDYQLVDVVAPSTQYYGEDAELLDQDDDDQVVLYNDPTDGVTQYYGEDAELADQDDDDQVVVDSQPQLTGDAPFDDGWDPWSQDDDDHSDQIDDYQLVENLNPVEDGWDWWSQEDDEQVVVLEFTYVDSNPVICLEDAGDHFPTDDDDYIVIDDYALVENLSPVEDSWDHWSTDDDDQVDAVEFQLVSVPLTSLQYYGEDAELLDQDDDDQVYPDTDVIGATLAQTFDDPWEHWPTEDDDYVVTDDYASVDNNPVICIEDAWDWAEQSDEDAPAPEDYQSVAPVLLAAYYGEDAELETQEGDEQWVADEQLSAPDDPPFSDGWDHFVAEDDEQLAIDEPLQAVAAPNPLLCVEDSWDHFTTDDSDDYFVVDDYALPTTFLALISGAAFCGGLALGTMTGPTPRVLYGLDPRFFNGSNAWLGFRTATGGGVW